MIKGIFGNEKYGFAASSFLILALDFLPFTFHFTPSIVRSLTRKSSSAFFFYLACCCKIPKCPSRIIARISISILYSPFFVSLHTFISSFPPVIFLLFFLPYYHSLFTRIPSNNSFPIFHQCFRARRHFFSFSKHVHFSLASLLRLS